MRGEVEVNEDSVSDINDEIDEWDTADSEAGLAPNIEQDYRDVLIASERIPETDIVDDEHITGPDDDDDEYEEGVLDESSTPRITIQHARRASPEAECNTEQMLRLTLDELKRDAMSTPFKDFRNAPQAEKNMSIGFNAVLRKVSVDMLVSLYMSGISPEMKELLAKPQLSWTPDDFSSLLEDFGDGSLVYVGFASGAIVHRHDIGVDCYVGSTGHGAKRVETHVKIAHDHGPDTLPAKHRRSFHYTQTCRSGVGCDYRVAARFQEPIEEGYRFLLESIFTMWFGTFNWPGYQSTFATTAAYDLCKRVRRLLNLPNPLWRGMNAAFQLVQGFCNHSAHRSSPCANPDCCCMTVPRQQGKRDRMLYDPGNPLGAYICAICTGYKIWHGEIPSKDWMVRAAAAAKRRQRAGRDAHCYSCDRVESQFELGCRQTVSGETIFSYAPFTTAQDVEPDEFLCQGCRGYANARGKLPDADWKVAMLTKWHMRMIRRAGGDLECENCGRNEAKDSPQGTQHRPYAERDHEVWCNKCIEHHHRTGNDRTVAADIRLDASRQADLRRNPDGPSVCENCGGLEGDPVCSQAKKLSLGRHVASGHGLLCQNCSMYIGAKGVHRPASTVFLARSKIEIARARAAGEHILCKQCGKEEGTTSINHHPSRTSVGAVCDFCYRRPHLR